MKKMWVLAVFCGLIQLTEVFAIAVPIAVQNSFKTFFPTASGVRWHKENAHEYEAEFELSGHKCSANFNVDGDWLETETEIGFNQLPPSVQSAFTKFHSKDKVRNAALIEMKKGAIQYEIEYASGILKKEMLFDSQGNIIK